MMKSETVFRKNKRGKRCHFQASLVLDLLGFAVELISNLCFLDLLYVPNEGSHKP